jgi:hypothetical protein
MSKKMSFDKKDLIKIAKGAGYAAGGSVCAYLLTVLPNFDFGPQTLMISAIVSILLNAGVKYFSK